MLRTLISKKTLSFFPVPRAGSQACSYGGQTGLHASKSPPPLGSCSAGTILKLLILFEQRTHPHFQFPLSPTYYAANVLTHFFFILLPLSWTFWVWRTRCPLVYPGGSFHRLPIRHSGGPREADDGTLLFSPDLGLILLLQCCHHASG